MNRTQIAALVCAAAFACQSAFAAPLFSDDFNTAASSASYAVITADATNSFAQFGYDYSVLGIPSAPNSGDGSTKGLRLNANVGATSAEAVNVATLASYSGSYTIRFDAWVNVNGPFPAGGNGSTNYLTAGVGSDGMTSNFVANTGVGGWTAVNGDNGSGVDYRLYKDAALQGVATAQYAAGTASNARNGESGYYNQFGGYDIANYPVQGANNGGPVQQTGTSDVGSFGMAWHRVTLDVSATGGTGGAAAVKWYVDDLLIGTLDAGANGAFSASGKVNLGYSDPTSNLSDNPPLSFALIDNLQIVPEPATTSLAALALLTMIGLRRRS